MQYRNVLITGAANGIGKEIAIQLSTQKSNLILIDNDNLGNLEIVSNLCKSNGAIVNSALIDVRNGVAVRAYLDEILSDNLKIDLVIASAGYLSQGRKMTPGFNLGENCIETNYYGVINIFEYFTEINNHNSHETTKLVALTSISKLVTTMNSGYYSASKAALAAYLDGLRLRNKGKNMQIHEIILGFVQTGMTNNIPHARKLGIRADTASKLILKAINRKIIRVHSIPRIRNLPWFLLSIFPNLFIGYVLHVLSKFIFKIKID